MKKWICVKRFDEYYKSMKQVRGAVIAFFVMVSLCVLPAPMASAESLTVNGGSVTIHSQVRKTHYILIDAQSNIIQITSNTTEDANPRVFLQKVALGNERVMTPRIYEQYSAIIPTGRTAVGTVYTRNTVVSSLPLFSPSLQKRDTDLLAFMNQ